MEQQLHKRLKDIQLKSKKRYLKDLVNNNVRVSKPDLIWEIDLFYFPKKNENISIKRQAYLSIIDSFSRYCIHVSNVTDDQSAKNIIKVLSEILKTNNQPKIIHTDYGIQFSSKIWYEYSLQIKHEYDTLISLGNVKQYNTYATNYCIKYCRQHYLYKPNTTIDTIADADKLIKTSIDSYNNGIKPMFDDTPYNVYTNETLKLAELAMSNQVKVPYKEEQIYVLRILELLKEKKLTEETIKKLDYSKLEVFTTKFKQNLIKSNLLVKKCEVIPKRKRDLILEPDLLHILDLDEIFLIKCNIVYTAKPWIFIQIKICILLLYVTGCRISEVTTFTFKDISLILKEGCVRIWVSKDKVQRTVYISNKKFLRRLDIYFNSLKAYCIDNNIVYDYNSYIFFKLKRINNVLVAVNSAPVSTMKEIVNNCLKYITATEKSALNKAWSTHSFRHSVITKLIEKKGIEKTSEFIGHKHIITTQLYHKKFNKHKVLKELADEI